MTEPRSREDRLHQALDKHGEQDKAASENQVASLSSPQEAIAHHKEQAIATEKEQETEAATEAEAEAEAEFEAAWFDATLDADVFFALEHVPPVQAAMLLCQFNPNNSTESEAERGSTDQISPGDFKRLRTTFLSIDQTKPAHRSMLDWMAVAAGFGLTVHPWAQQYVQHRGLYIAAAPIPAQISSTDANSQSDTRGRLGIGYPESKEVRQATRWKLCLDAGLKMPTDTYSHFPRGIGKIAKELGITRQALAEDLNEHRERNFGR